MRLPEHEKVYVAGRLLFEGGRFVVTDRLGSVVYTCATGLSMQNTGFESGTTNWTPYGGAQQGISGVARSGGLSLRQTTTVANAGSYQDIAGLIPGRAYQFVAWVRSESGEVPARVKVSDTTGANTVSGSGLAYDSIWWTITAVFTATAEGVARVRLEMPTTTGVLLWDDVEVMPAGDTCAKAVKLKYYPYGQEMGTVTENDTAKFGTYTRDAATGLDYAMNRYYQSTWGRFTSPDPYRASGGPGDPGSWNRYSYVQGDPVNRSDPSGLYWEHPMSYLEAPDGGWAWSGAVEAGYGLWNAYQTNWGPEGPVFGSNFPGANVGVTVGQAISCATKYAPEVDLGLFLGSVGMDEFESLELFGPPLGEKEPHVLPAFAVAAATAAQWVVYWGRSPQGQYYFGITMNFAARQAAHLKRDMHITMMNMPRMNYAAAKGVEQALIEWGRTTSAGVSNKINSISLFSPYYQHFKDMGTDILNKCSGALPPGMQGLP